MDSGMENQAELGGPNPIDRHVGLRIRMRRRELGVSQEKLADSIGLTFQQVQKYERAANRVSASKLWEMARALHTSVNYFYEGLGPASPEQPGSNAPRDVVQDFLLTSDGLELAAQKVKPGEMTGITPGFIKRAPVAWFASHRHTPDGKNEAYAYSYLFAYTIDVPANAKTLTLPNNDYVRILAITGTNERFSIKPAQPLYDTLERNP